MALAWCQELLKNTQAPLPPSKLGEYELFEIKNITAKYLHAAGCSSAKVREVLQHEKLNFKNSFKASRNTGC